MTVCTPANPALPSMLETSTGRSTAKVEGPSTSGSGSTWKMPAWASNVQLVIPPPDPTSTGVPYTRPAGRLSVSRTVPKSLPKNCAVSRKTRFSPMRASRERPAAEGGSPA